MTAVSLFDVLAREGSGLSTGDSQSSEALARLAENLVAASLADLDRLRGYERQFASPPEASSCDADLIRTLWRLYADWADDAEQVLARAKSAGRSGVSIEGAYHLDDAIGRTRARLSVTPEHLISAIEQVHQGKVIPAKELRNELHARLRA